MRERTTPVIQCDLDGNIIKEFKSMQEASRETGISMNMIYQSCNNYINHTKEFTWQYKGNNIYTDTLKNCNGEEVYAEVNLKGVTVILRGVLSDDECLFIFYKDGKIKQIHSNPQTLKEQILDDLKMVYPIKSNDYWELEDKFFKGMIRV